MMMNPNNKITILETKTIDGIRIELCINQGRFKLYEIRIYIDINHSVFTDQFESYLFKRESQARLVFNNIDENNIQALQIAKALAENYSKSKHMARDMVYKLSPSWNKKIQRRMAADEEDRNSER